MSLRLVTKSIWCNPGNRGKRLKKTFNAVRWQVYKRTVKSSRVLKLPNNVLFRAYPDCVVSSALVYADWPEYHELTFLRKHLPADHVIIDVGANVGHVSLLLADVVGSSNILAFEPTPISFSRLTENWQLNGWPTKGLMQAAVGEKTGTVFVQDVDRPVTTNAVANTPGRQGFVKVPLVCLDDLGDLWQGRRVGLLKIDVEGYEAEVLRGSAGFVRQHRPLFVMFESLSGDLDRGIASLLKDCGYIVFQLNSDQQPDFTRHSAQNLFALPEEHRHRFQG